MNVCMYVCVCVVYMSAQWLIHCMPHSMSTCVVCTIVPATIEPSETEYRMMQHDNVMLRCRASGVPQPTVSWSKDGVPLSDRDLRYRLLRSGWLAIAVVR